MTETRRITRSRDEQMIAGVCGGLAEWLDLDPSIVRLIFILMALTFGHGILVYLVLALVMPLEK
jgi:phage shock protein C